MFQNHFGINGRISMKKILLYILSTITILSCISISSVQVYAHDALLNVEYDDCIYNLNGDGIDEMWYTLNNSSSCWHLDDNITTIKYYFENVSDFAQDAFLYACSKGNI